MKFRKRVKLFPGVTLNFSKTGISTTVGVPGASVNFNRQGTFLNTGIPGTGIYDRQRIGGKKASHNNSFSPQTYTQDSDYQNITPIQTADLESATSKGLLKLRNTLLECHQEREELQNDILKAKSSLSWSYTLLMLSYFFLIGFVIKWFKQNQLEKQEDVKELEKQLKECYIPVEFKGDGEIGPAFEALHEAYKDLLTCERIWDITSKVSINQIAARSAAATTISREQVRFALADLDIIKCCYRALHFENANGGDLFIYPGFIALVDADHNFGLVDMRELEFNFISKRFVEEQPVPSDATVVGHTWSKVNKDGSPDRRFRDNYQIPICLYGDIELKSATGLDEAYSFSDHEKVKAFAEAFLFYQRLVG